MKLQDNHNEFTVRCFAEYMPLRDVVDAFMLEFKHDLPNPPPPPEFTNYQEEVPECEYQFRKNEYIKEKLKEIKSRYFNIYSVNSSVKFEKEEANYIEKFKLEFEKEWQKEREEKYAEQLSEYQVILDNHNMQIRKELSNKLRRLNITHSQFPEKYRQLFNEARETFFKSKTDENITNDDITQDDNILQELELMFSHVKNLMFLEKEPKEVLKHVDRAHNILKTIASYNKDERKNTNKDPRNIDENNPAQ